MNVEIGKTETRPAVNAAIIEYQLSTFSIVAFPL